MRKFMWVPLVLVAAAFACRLSASEGMEDFVKLVKSGANEEVLLAYVEASPVAYQPTLEEIRYLQDVGVTDTVITALMKRGEALRLAAAKGEAPPVAQPAAAPPQPEPAPPVQPAVQEPVLGKPAPEPAVADAALPAPPVQPAAAGELAPGERVVRETVISQDAAPPADSAVAPVVTAPPSGEVTVSYFYESLSPYGKWVDADGVWVWQPTAVVMDPAWRPYCHRGHWVLTDSGWTWASDYSWGWAAFHYGRWSIVAGYGWVWTPDTVWGPAWVNWRMSDSHYGWAPLPPAARFEVGVGLSLRGKHVGFDLNFGLVERDYCFVPTESFLEIDLGRRVLRPEHVARVYNTTVIIENTYVYKDNRIINHGPAVEHVQIATGREIKPVKLVDANVKSGQPLRGEARSKDTLALYRPKVAATAPEAPPAVLARQEVARKQQAQLAQSRAAASGAAKPAPAATRETQLLQQHALATAQARQHKDAADAAEKENKRLEEAAAAETNQQKREALRLAAQAEKQKAADSRAQQQRAEQQAEAHKQAANEAAAARKEALAHPAPSDTQHKAQPAAEPATRTTAQKEVPVHQEQLDAQHKAQAAAEAATKEQARKDALARQEPSDAQRKAEAAAEAAKREQTHKEPSDVQHKAQVASEAVAKEHEPAVRKDTGQTQGKEETDSQRPRAQPSASVPPKAVAPPTTGTADQRSKDAKDADAKRRGDRDASSKRGDQGN
ncbi:MAG: DUF6600 domain-containing protein [Planctomycetota bacterium]